MTNSTHPFGGLFNNGDDNNDSHPDDLDQLIDPNALKQLSSLVDRRIHTILDALITHHIENRLQSGITSQLSQAFLPSSLATADPYRLCVTAEGTSQAVEDFLHQLHAAQIVEMNDWSRPVRGRNDGQILRVYMRHYPWRSR